MRSIDLNADMGEYGDDESAAIEAALMPLVSSCSIACGGHAGDKTTMRRTARLAKAHGVSVGAHPSYPDREGFGRRTINIGKDELLASLKNQIDGLRAVLIEDAMTIAHVKPHGALYNDAARDKDLARLIVAAAPGLAFVGPPNSALQMAALEAGTAFVAEGFVDRLYRRNGSLTPRSEPGAIIANIKARANQARSIALGETFAAADGEITLEADTLCIHSDSPGAIETARAVRDALSAADVKISRFGAASS